MKQLAIALEHVLKARLPIINRWNDVNVHYPGDLWPHDVSQIYEDDLKHVIIHWHGNKNGKNVNKYEIKEIPLEDIGLLIERNAKKIINNRNDYK